MKFDSKVEERFYNDIDAIKKLAEKVGFGEVLMVVPQPFSMKIYSGKYTPDFLVHCTFGIIVVEIKGYLKERSRRNTRMAIKQAVGRFKKGWIFVEVIPTPKRKSIPRGWVALTKNWMYSIIKPEEQLNETLVF